MNSWKARFAVLLLAAGLVSACAAQPTVESTVPPTEEVVAATQAPTDPPAATNTSAPATEAAAGGTTVSFATDVLPIFESRCLNCHGGQRTEHGLSLRTYADAMTGSEGGSVIVPGDADNSNLVELIAAQKMPKRGPKLTPSQVQVIIDWVNQGALNN